MKLDPAHAGINILNQKHVWPQAIIRRRSPVGKAGEQFANLIPLGDRTREFAIGLAGVARHWTNAGLSSGNDRRAVLVNADRGQALGSG